MVTHSPTLQIAIVGAGNIGSTFAFQLSSIGGHDVTVVARPGSCRLDQLQRDGAIVDVTGLRAKVRIADELDEKIAYDLVIVTVLAHQVGAILPTLHRSAALCIQFMFNTFETAHLQDAIGIERCTFGMPFVQAILTADGRLKATIGAGGQKTIMAQQRWVDVFSESGLPAAVEPDMPLWLRCHAPLCVAFESISVAGERRGGGATWRESQRVAHGVHASFDLIKGLGFEIYPSSARRISAAPASVLAVVLWALSRVPSFRKLLATGQVECAALVDAMLAAAPRSNPPAENSAIAAMKPV